MRGALIFAVCFALVAPVTEAAPFTPQMDFAYRLAVQHWGRAPADCSSIDFEVVPDGSIGPEGTFEGEATMPPTDAVIPCDLYIIRKLAAPDWFERMCTVMRHEVGHLEGLHHSSDAASIMYPEVTFTPSQCTEKGLWLMNHPNAFGRPS